MKNIAIILAGGVGQRLNYGIPKQFYKIAGKTVIEHTVDVFEKNVQIDEIAIVINPLYVERIEDMILSNSWKKVKKILVGGKERFESSLSAINAYSSGGECNLIFHDAVRPLISNRIINDVIEALKSNAAVDVVLPATDTIVEVNNKYIKSIPDRRCIYRGQTPQGFKLSVIKDAYTLALQDPTFISTDDCGVIIKYMPDEKVYTVDGEESNIKLTHKEDIYLLDKLFQIHSTDVFNDIDFSLFEGKVVVVFGGNSGIGKAMVDLLKSKNITTYSFSRSTTNTDIADQESVKEAFSKVYNQVGRIDYVINTAAILSKEPLVTMERELISNIVNTNYLGMINIAVESYHYLKETKGHLLCFTSSSYTRGRAFYSIYSSTKSAVVNFVQAIAQEWECDDIRVNAINPERTKTPMRVQNFGLEQEDTLLSAEDVAEISIKTLLSYFTGQTVDVRIMV